MNIYLEQVLRKTKWQVQEAASLSQDGIEWAALVTTTQLHKIGEQEQQFFVIGLYSEYITLRVSSIHLLECFLWSVPS